MTSTAEQTMRGQAKAALADIKAVFEQHGDDLGYPDRESIRKACTTLLELTTQIPAEPAGSPLRWSGMADAEIAKAVRYAEHGLASPGAVLEMAREVRHIRSELRALGGPYGVTEEDIRSLIAEGFHTAFRKAADSVNATIAWKAIRDMDSEEYSQICRFVSGTVIRLLREAESKAAERSQPADTGTAPAGTEPPFPLGDPELALAAVRYAMSKGAIITRKWFGLNGPGECSACGSPSRDFRYYVPGATGQPVTCGSDWHDDDARGPGYPS